MTGSEYRALIHSLGITQKEAALRMGIDQNTLIARCKENEVPVLYAFALQWLALEIGKNRVPGYYRATLNETPKREVVVHWDGVNYWIPGETDSCEEGRLINISATPINLASLP